MKLVSFQQTVPANSTVEATVDLSLMAKYLLWAWVLSDWEVLIKRLGDTVASGWGIGPSGAADAFPLFISEDTADPFSITLYNDSSSPATITVVLALSNNRTFGDLIDKGFHLRTRHMVAPPLPSLPDYQLILNDKSGIDYVVMLMWFTKQYPKWISTSWGEEVLSPVTDFYHSPTMLEVNTRLAQGQYLVGDLYALPAVPSPQGSAAVIWELPAGATVPPITPPVITPPQIHIPVPPWSPEPWPPWPYIPPWPPWAPPPGEGGYQTPVLPYPAAPDERTLLTPPIPETAQSDLARDITNLPYKMKPLPWQDIPGLVSLVGIGPTAVHVLRMDDVGRIRTASAAVLYNAGKVEKTDATSTTITPDRPGARVSFKAVALGWEIKVLTIYDLLAGNDFSSAETIYLDAGDSFDEPLEAAQIQVSCPSATASSAGKLYYYVGI